MKELTLVTKDCALPVEDVIVLMKFFYEEFDQKEMKMKSKYNVQVMLSNQQAPINIGCDTEKEMEELFNYILEERNKRK